MGFFQDLKEDLSLLASYNDNQSSNSYLHIYCPGYLFYM